MGWKRKGGRGVGESRDYEYIHIIMSLADCI